MSATTDTVVVGAPDEDSAATGVDGDETSDAASDGYGTSVAVWGDELIVGAPLERSRATGIDGDQSNNLGTANGAAYILQRFSGNWDTRSYVKSSSNDDQDRFGSSAAIWGDTFVIGISRDSAQSGGAEVFR